MALDTVNRITELALREKRKYSDFAVLYRVNAQSGGLEGGRSAPAQ